MVRLKFPLFYLIALLIFTGTSWGDNITNVNISIQFPASLSLGERITVSFNYSTNYNKGVRIFVRPMTNGSLSPNYAAHPSTTYNLRNGNGSGFFTISKGDITVDNIRITIVSTAGTVLFTKIVPVELHFSDNPIRVIDKSKLPVLEPKSEPVNARVKRNILKKFWCTAIKK